MVTCGSWLFLLLEQPFVVLFEDADRVAETLHLVTIHQVFRPGRLHEVLLFELRVVHLLPGSQSDLLLNLQIKSLLVVQESALLLRDCKSLLDNMDEILQCTVAAPRGLWKPLGGQGPRE